MNNPWLQAHSGAPIDFLSPSPEQIFVTDIAWSLSHLCRFNGHTKKFYSVAEHSVLVSLAVPPEDACWGLMHDAAEAYIGDVTSPLKAILGARYRAIDEVFKVLIAERFELPESIPDSVKEADLRMLTTERFQAMSGGSRDWNLTVAPYPEVILQFWNPKQARINFMKRFKEIFLDKKV